MADKKDIIIVDNTPEAQKVTYGYIGPTITGVLHGPKYFIGYPVWLEKLFTDCPAVKALFIPHDQVPQAMINLRDPASRESSLVRAVNAYIEKNIKLNPYLKTSVTLRPRT